MQKLLLIVALWLAVAWCAAIPIKQQEIGFFVPLTGPFVSSAANFVPMVEYTMSLITPKLPYLNLSISYYDSVADDTPTAKAFLTTLTFPNFSVLPSPNVTRWKSTIISSLLYSERPTTKLATVVGDIRAASTQLLGWMANYLNFPHVITTAPAASFSNNTLFPNTYRAFLGDSTAGTKLKMVMDEFGWKRFALFVSSQAQGLEFAQWLQKNFDTNSYVYDIYYLDVDDMDSFEQVVPVYLADLLAKDYRIIVNQLTVESGLPLMRLALQYGLAGPASQRVWIGFQLCSLVRQYSTKEDLKILLGTFCIAIQKPLDRVTWTNIPYYINDSSLFTYGPNSQLLGAGNAIEVVATAINNLNAASHAVNGSSLMNAISSLNSQGLFSKLLFKSNGNLEIGVELMNFRSIADGDYTYYDIVRTADASATTWNIIDDIIFYDGSTNVPSDRFYKYAEGTIVYNDLPGIGVLIGVVFSVVGTAASYISLMGFLYQKQHLLQRVRKPTIKRQILTLFPWALVAAYSIGVGNFAVMQLSITGLMVDELKYFITLDQIIPAILVPFVLALATLVVIAGEIKQDMHIIGKNGSKSDESDNNMSYNGTASLKSTTANNNNSISNANAANAKQLKKERARERKRASRAFCVWFYKDLRYTFAMTSIRLTISSLLLVGAIIAPIDLLVAGIISPTYISFNVGVEIAEIVVCWLLMHYFLIKLLFERDSAWRVLTGLALVGIPLAIRAISQNAAYQMRWDNNQETFWNDPDSYVNSSNLLMISSGLAAGAALILVGLLVERLKLSRNTLDVMLLNSQLALKKLEDENQKAKDEKLAMLANHDRMTRILELLISCRPLFREYAYAFSNSPSVGKQATMHGRDASIAVATSAAAARASPNLPAMTEGDAFPFALFSLATNCSQLTESLFETKNELHMMQVFDEIAGILNVDNPIGVAHSLAAALTEDITLVEILSHPVCFDVFRDKLTRVSPDICDRPIELVCLWLDINYFRKLTDVFVRRSIANGIFETFLSTSAIYPIPALQRLRPSVQTILYSSPVHLFDIVEAQLLELLSGAFSFFKSTHEFKFCVLLLGHPCAVQGKLSQLLKPEVSGLKGSNNSSGSHFAEITKKFKDSQYVRNRSLMHQHSTETSTRTPPFFTSPVMASRKGVVSKKSGITTEPPVPSTSFPASDSFDSESSVIAYSPNELETEGTSQTLPQ